MKGCTANISDTSDSNSDSDNSDIQIFNPREALTITSNNPFLSQAAPPPTAEAEPEPELVQETEHIPGLTHLPSPPPSPPSHPTPVEQQPNLTIVTEEGNQVNIEEALHRLLEALRS